MIADVRAALAGLPRLPKVCVIGALGRCGKGSAHILEQSGVTGDNAALWDLPETKKVSILSARSFKVSHMRRHASAESASLLLQ